MYILKNNRPRRIVENWKIHPNPDDEDEMVNN
jgi:hypothetical protein